MLSNDALHGGSTVTSSDLCQGHDLGDVIAGFCIQPWGVRGRQAGESPVNAQVGRDRNVNVTPVSWRSD